MDWSQCSGVDRDPQRMGGVWCFKSKRIALASLFEHLYLGSTVDEFLEWFPSVTREEVNEVLAFAKRSLDEPPVAA